MLVPTIPAPPLLTHAEAAGLLTGHSRRPQTHVHACAHTFVSIIIFTGPLPSTSSAWATRSRHAKLPLPHVCRRACRCVLCESGARGFAQVRSRNVLSSMKAKRTATHTLCWCRGSYKSCESQTPLRLYSQWQHPFLQQKKSFFFWSKKKLVDASIGV